MKNFKTLILFSIMIECSVNGQGHVRSPLDPPKSTVISNRCLNNNLREMIKFHFLKLLPKVRIWNFNQNTLTTFHQNSYRIILYNPILCPYCQGFKDRKVQILSVLLWSEISSKSGLADQLILTIWNKVLFWSAVPLRVHRGWFFGIGGR